MLKILPYLYYLPLVGLQGDAFSIWRYGICVRAAYECATFALEGLRCVGEIQSDLQYFFWAISAVGEDSVVAAIKRGIGSGE